MSLSGKVAAMRLAFLLHSFCPHALDAHSFPFRADSNLDGTAAGVPWGLVFFGMSLSQRAPGVLSGNQASVTHQTKFDLNRLQDRANQYLCKTSDDGWLAGGGNGPSSFLLPHIDSAHMELLHPGTICSSVAANSSVQPDTTRFRHNRTFITGAPLAVLIERVRSKLAFDPIRVVPTGDQFTLTDEYQLRFNPQLREGDGEPLVNPTMTQVYHELVKEFRDVHMLDKGDPFHVSMCRETKPCSNQSRSDFRRNNELLTVQPWREWASSLNGTLLNDEIPQYKHIPGGFYLFVTRDRPLIYFSPKLAGADANGSLAYYCEWHQDGKIVDFANPYGGPVEEVLVPIPDGTSVHDFTSQNAVLSRFSSDLCERFSYRHLPTTKWTPTRSASESTSNDEVDALPMITLI